MKRLTTVMLCTWMWMLTACSGDDNSADQSPGDSTAGGQGISGTVTRTGSLGSGGDGKGKLYMQLMDTCITSAESAPTIISVVTVEDADLSTTTKSVEFAFTNIPDGSYQLQGYLDDVDSTKPPTTDPPLPSKGDLVAVAGVTPTCVAVTVAGKAVKDVKFELNLASPIDL